MQPKDKRVISKIIHRIKSTLQYCEGVDYDRFEQDTLISDACVFNLLQIGEMCNRELSNEFKNMNPQIPWRQICGLRNRIVHDYDDIKLNIIWNTIQDDLPKLLRDLESVLA